MSTNYSYKYKDFAIVNIPSDVQVTLDSYLADQTNGTPFINSTTGAVDLFTVSFLVSSMPVSGTNAQYVSYISQLIEGFVNTQYTTTLGGTLVVGSQIISSLSTTSNLLPGMSVVGTGIPTDAVIASVRSSSQIQFSGVGATVGGPQSITFSTTTWNIDYSQIVALTNIVNFHLL